MARTQVRATITSFRLTTGFDLGANFYRYKKNGRMGIWNLSLCNAYFKANPFSVRPIYYQTEKGREVVLEQTLLFLFVPSVFLYI